MSKWAYGILCCWNTKRRERYEECVQIELYDELRQKRIYIYHGEHEEEYMSNVRVMMNSTYTAHLLLSIYHFLQKVPTRKTSWRH